VLQRQSFGQKSNRKEKKKRKEKKRKPSEEKVMTFSP